MMNIYTLYILHKNPYERLCTLPIDKQRKMWYNGRLAYSPKRAELIIIAHYSKFVKRKLLAKCTIFFPVICATFTLTNSKLNVII